jgi:hypothetical protein
MFNSNSVPYLNVPVSEATIFTVQGPAATAKTVVVENLDATNTMTYKYQYSDDGVTYTDAATFTTLAPAARVRSNPVNHIWWRLRASGNLYIAVKVDYEGTFSGTFICS